MKKIRIIKAWAVIGGEYLIEIFHGEKKREVIGYDICINKREAQKCKRLHCENDDYYKIVKVEIKILDK